MNKSINIRNESEADYKIVEEITRKSFWNLYVPGCSEHYLVHIMRHHEDFVPELDFVIEVHGKIIGNIMYTKARLVAESGEEKNILTFGPVSIAPEYQRMGYGKRLIEHSFNEASLLGYDVIIIFGNPANYVGLGFKSCIKYNVSIANATYPMAMMIKELKVDALEKNKKWIYYDSPVMQLDLDKAEHFDEGFEKMEKKWQPSQEEFYIYSHSTLSDS